MASCAGDTAIYSSPRCGRSRKSSAKTDPPPRACASNNSRAKAVNRAANNSSPSPTCSTRKKTSSVPRGISSAATGTTRKWPRTYGVVARFAGRVARPARAGIGAVAGLRVRRPSVSGQRGDAGRCRQLGQGERLQRRRAWPSALRRDHGGADCATAFAETARE